MNDLKKIIEYKGNNVHELRQQAYVLSVKKQGKIKSLSLLEAVLNDIKYYRDNNQDGEFTANVEYRKENWVYNEKDPSVEFQFIFKKGVFISLKRA